MGTPQAGVFDFVRHLKAPHGLSVVLALGVAFVAIGAVFLLIGEEAYAVLGAPARIAAYRSCFARGQPRTKAGLNDRCFLPLSSDNVWAS